MQTKAFPFNGSSLYEGDVPGYQTSYRFHLADPVRFARSLRVTMEHGHGNHSANDWASTAYWYQSLPGPPLTVPPVAQRLPLRNGDLGVVPVLPPLAVPAPPGGLTDEQRRMSAQHRDRVQRQQAEWAAEYGRPLGGLPGAEPAQRGRRPGPAPRLARRRRPGAGLSGVSGALAPGPQGVPAGSSRKRP